MNINDTDDLRRFFVDGDVEAIERWMATEGTDVNVTDIYEDTPLHLAARSGLDDVIEMLLDAEGIEVNARNRYEETPLHLAVMFDHAVIVARLLDNGADVNARNWSGETPLHLATERGHVDIVERLLATEGVDVNVIDTYDYTPLHLAARAGHDDVVRLLLDAEGIEVNVRDRFDDTPLHLAARFDHVEIVEMLWSRGTDLNARNQFGDTFYDWTTDRVKHMFRELVITRREVLLHLYIHYDFPIEMVRTINEYLPWLPIMIRVRKNTLESVQEMITELQIR